MKYRISVSDCFTTSESILESKSGYFSIEDIFAIIEANTDLFRELPKPQPPKEEISLLQAKIERLEKEEKDHHKLIDSLNEKILEMVRKK